MRPIALLLALAPTLAASADDTDPEPRGTPLRRLQGVWDVRAVLAKGQERNSGGTYAFDKGKVTVSPAGKGPTREMKLEADKSRKDLVVMTIDRGRPMRYFFKVEKGELYLAPVRPTDAKPEPDFSGDTAPVLIMRRGKK